MNKLLKEKIDIVPHKPGVYLYKNINEKIIYVGKAKNLYKRIHQYFTGKKDYKTMKLVQNIFDIDFLVVNNANEALILENNLIKKYKPEFNILLKDSYTYPYILITNEMHPRILYTTKYNLTKGKYYGPLADSSFNKFKIYKLLNEIIPFRKCNKIPNKICVYGQIGQCLAPCVNKINKNIYDEYKKKINNIFNKKTNDLMQELIKKEEKSANNLDFELAQYYKDAIDGLNNFTNQQSIEITNKNSIDYIGFKVINESLVVSIFSYTNKMLHSKYQIIIDADNWYDINNDLSNVCMQYYSSNVLPKQVYIQISDEYLTELSSVFNINFNVPIKNNDKQIMSMLLLNCEEYYKIHKLSHINKNKIHKEAWKQLEDLLNIKINQIDIFDNSNLFGKDPVAACISYINGYYDKTLSRNYRLKTDLKGDTNYMFEVIYRKYLRCIKYKYNLPELIIVDGGINQINSAKNALFKIGLNSIMVIGLKKDKQHKTNSIVLSDNNEIKLDKNSSLYLLCFNMQEDVHNCAINFYKKSSIKSMFITELDKIKGLGPKRKELIIKHFNSIDELKNTSLQDLVQIIPKKIAILLKESIK